MDASENVDEPDERRARAVSDKRQRKVANAARLSRCRKTFARLGATEDGFADARRVVCEAIARGLAADPPSPFPEEQRRLRLIAQLADDQARRLPVQRLGNASVASALDELEVLEQCLLLFEESLASTNPDRLQQDVALLSIGRAQACIDVLLAAIERGRVHGEKPGSRGWEARELARQQPTITARELASRGARSIDERYAQRILADARKKLTK